jgi:hypothetical protein
MAAKAWGSQQKSVEEVFFQNDAVSLCMMIHRRSKTMRVIDFRAGPSSAKRMFVMSMAQREGMEKVYTLVERDEVSTWAKMGFAREGNIPGFYKRSDAFLLGASVAARRSSEMRISLRDRKPPEEAHVDIDGEEVEEEPVDTTAHDFAERTIVHAKKRAKELVGKPLPAAKVAAISEADAKKRSATALKAGRALTAFEPFGRDVQREYFLVTAKGGFELVASTESQACFGNAFLELLTPPKTEAERLATVSGLRALCDLMLGRGIVSCFSLAPSDDLPMATAFAFNGFRRTGLLQNHQVVGSDRKDAILWSKKMAAPGEE